MEQKRSLALRPIAWVCTILMVLALQYIAEVACRLGELLFVWINGLSTVVIVILVVAFGGTFCSILFYAAIGLPSLLVALSDKIYPSNHAFRYYFVGIYEIIGCVILILAGVGGLVSGGPMFWFYARYIWLIIASIVMMVNGRSEAKERHNQAPIQETNEV